MRHAIVAFACVSVFGAASTASGQVVRIDRLVETLDLRADGSGHVVTTIEVPAGPGAIVRLPVGLGRPGSPTVRGIAAATVSVDTDSARPFLTVGLPALLPAPARLDVEYEVGRVVDMAAPSLAHGNRRLRCEFVNTSGVVIAELEETVLLPADTVVANLAEIAPSAAARASPVALVDREGRSAVTIGAKALAPSERVGAVVDVMPRPSRWRLLAALAALSAAYLYAFRDIVRAPAAHGSEAPAS